jgi:hypothetical protein
MPRIACVIRPVVPRVGELGAAAGFGTSTSRMDEAASGKQF